MKTVRALGLCVLLLVGLTSAGCAARSQTLEAMLRAADAFKRKDYPTFEKYVDVESLIAQAVDLTIGEMRERAGVFGSLLGDAGAALKPKVVSLTRKQFKRVFETGLVQSQVGGLDSLPSSELLFKLVALMGVPEDSSKYRINDVQQTSGGEQLKIDLNLGSGGNPDWLPLHVQAKKVGDHVRIEKIVNLKDIFKRVLRSAIHWP